VSAVGHDDIVTPELTPFAKHSSVEMIAYAEVLVSMGS